MKFKKNIGTFSSFAQSEYEYFVNHGLIKPFFIKLRMVWVLVETSVRIINIKIWVVIITLFLLPLICNTMKIYQRKQSNSNKFY